MSGSKVYYNTTHSQVSNTDLMLPSLVCSGEGIYLHSIHHVGAVTDTSYVC